ncbi:MAG: NfeD family protein [Chlamydiales bacterium]|nr:NfeD family protein [Chlamydiales bacterium]
MNSQVLSSVVALIGIFLIYVEFYLPGAVLGILGACLMLFSVVYFAINNTFVETLFFFLGSCILLGLVVKLAIARIRKSKEGVGIYLGKDQAGYSASGFSKDAIGKIATTLSDLKPAGHILVDGKKWQALSVSGYIESGKKVKVIGGEGSHLVVQSQNSG